MNSFHLKQCVQTFNVFDFLRQIVSKVPGLGGSDTAGEERSVAKRRKVDDEDTDDELKKSRMHETAHTSISGRGRGRGQGRGRGRGIQTVVEKEMSAHYKKLEDDQLISYHQDKHNGNLERQSSGEEPEQSKDNIPASDTKVPVRNFDLNVDLDENGDSKAIPVPTQATVTTKVTPELTKVAPEAKPEEYPGWSLTDIEKMALYSIQLANLSRRIDEDEDDYDEG